MSACLTKNSSLEIQPEVYEIRIQGILDPDWSEWLECSKMNHTTSETILSCVIQDQARLHGLLAKIRDMNLKLISLTRLEQEESIRS